MPSRRPIDAEVPIPPPLTDLPAALRALRTDRERLFVWHYMFNGGEGAKAARAAGYSDVAEGAKVRASQLLTRDDVQEAVRALCTKYLFSLAPTALVKLRQHLLSDNEKISLKATELTLSRTGFGERQSLDVNVSGSVTVDHTSEALEQLRTLRGLGVPREKLVDIFGFSGLARYERMLAARDAPKLIEGEVVDPADVSHDEHSS